MLGPKGAGLGAEGVLEHGQSWEMCESFCHATFLSCFSKKKKEYIYIYTHIQKTQVPNAIFYVCCSLVSCFPADRRLRGVMERVEKGKPEGQGGWEEV